MGGQGQRREVDVTDVGKEDLPDVSNVPGHTLSVSLATLTCWGNCRCLDWKEK